MRDLHGESTGRGLRIGIAYARFNEFVGERLLSGALAALARAGVADAAITLARVPGCFELPLTARKLAADHDAVICLGVLIKGETPHFEYIASECTRGIGEAALASGVPVIYSVLTTNTLEAAIDRAGGKMGNKGAEAAQTAVEMANLHRQIAKPARRK